MVARATRQYAEILAAGDGKARITRQYVEVLSDTSLYGSGADALGLSDAALGVAVPPGGTEYERAATDVLSLADTALFQMIYSIGNVLELLDAATFNRAFALPVTDPLSLSQTVDKRGPIYMGVQHVLQLEQPVNGHVGTVNVTVGDTLELSGQAGRTSAATAASVLSFSDSGSRSNVAQSVLTLVGTALAGKAKEADSVLALVQVVGLEARLLRGLVSDLGLVQSGTYQLVGPSCVTHTYQPFVGFSTDTTITPPDVAAPVLADAMLTLTYPFVAPTYTVVLRNPEFSNKDNLNFNRINRQTRGGTLVVYADANWPKTQTFQVEVQGLKAAQVADLLVFFGVSLGKEVGLLDHENRQWKGIIMDPDTPVNHVARSDRTVSFTFEGEL